MQKAGHVTPWKEQRGVRIAARRVLESGRKGKGAAEVRLFACQLHEAGEPGLAGEVEREQRTECRLDLDEGTVVLALVSLLTPQIRWYRIRLFG